MQFLVFQLYGPLAAWGDIAVGEQRHSDAHPSRSAILGLVAAALGIRREQEADLKKISESLGVAVMVEAEGEWLRDYHTAQVPPAKRKIKYYTRRDELKEHDLYTILSQRDYRTDACYRVALWCKQKGSSYSTDQIKFALSKPCFPLYLGRKSCPPALPLRPLIIESNSLASAFDNYYQSLPGEFYELLGHLDFNNTTACYWEPLPKGVDAGIAVQQIHRRRDEVLSRQRWQFGEREEYRGINNRGES